MDVQNAKALTITEGEVRTIHDSTGKQLWGRVAYDTKYAGDTTQAGTPTPDSPQAINVVKDTQTITLTDGVVSDSFTVGLTGKNLLNFSTMQQGSFNYVTNADNSDANRIRSAYIQCTPSTKYTISANTTLGEVGVVYLDSDGATITGSGGTVNVSTYTFTSKANAVLMRIRVGSTSYPFTTSGSYDLMLEQSDSATTYVPYFTPIELAKIGTYQDYIYKSSGNWYVHKAIGVSSLGSLTWSYSDTATANKYRMYTSGLSGQYVSPASNADTPLFISNYFVGVTANSNYNNTVGLASNPTGTALYAYHPDYTATTSPSDFKTWLTNNGVVLYYALKTESDTLITDATLISQLEAIHNWLTRYGYQSSVVGSLPIVISQTNL